MVKSATDPTLKSKMTEADGEGRHITRREALRQAGLGVAVAGVGAFAAGCGASTSRAPHPAQQGSHFAAVHSQPH